MQLSSSFKRFMYQNQPTDDPNASWTRTFNPRNLTLCYETDRRGKTVKVTHWITLVYREKPTGEFEPVYIAFAHEGKISFRAQGDYTYVMLDGKLEIMKTTTADGVLYVCTLEPYASSAAKNAQYGYALPAFPLATRPAKDTGAQSLGLTKVDESVADEEVLARIRELRTEKSWPKLISYARSLGVKTGTKGRTQYVVVRDIIIAERKADAEKDTVVSSAA